MKPTVGFAGLGVMGKPMAQNAAKAGFAVTVYNRTAPDPKTLPGLAIAATPFELAKGCDTLVVMVTDPHAVDALLWGELGMAKALGPGKTFINMSTVPPAYTTELAEKITAAGAAFVDAPVSGSKLAAESAGLVILAGGAKETVDGLAPLFSCLGKKTVHCGDAPGGTMMKLSVNLMLCAVMTGFAEMLTFARTGGLSVQTVLDVVSNGPLACDFIRMKAPLVTQDDFSQAQFALKHMVKDLQFIVDTACEMRCPAPSAFTNMQLYNQAIAKGLGEQDLSSIVRVLEAML